MKTTVFHSFFWLYSITISFSVENRWFILYVLEGKLFKYSDEILNTFLPSLQRDISQFEIGSRRRIFFINLFLMCLNFFSYFFFFDSCYHLRIFGRWICGKKFNPVTLICNCQIQLIGRMLFLIFSSPSLLWQEIGMDLSGNRPQNSLFCHQRDF